MEESSVPSLDIWLKEAKEAPKAAQCGMYLFHNGVVRSSAKALVRETGNETRPVCGMLFSYDQERESAAIAQTYKMPGIHYIRVWLNSGQLQVGDDLMLVLVGGDIRPHVIDALQFLVGELKNICVSEQEIFEVE